MNFSTSNSQSRTKQRGNAPVRCMQYARLPVGKSRKNRVTDKESKGFAYLCTNLNDWGMSDIFNSSHFFTGTNEVLPEQPRNPGRSRNLLEQGEEYCTLQICCFYLFTFYLFTFFCEGLPIRSRGRSAVRASVRFSRCGSRRLPGWRRVR